ncbi:hypothetical protein PROQFM164_S02g002875 [Penicillium roqueforti FM164]|uniref:Uncharacterized protein n=1 Tax=Penicillium roqueforti (strain FM164) TaxID=1365484 RepID=W6QEU4_PENRF|nr:hypothetical protein PROQFM164_S02g002875 [Penicillium roqueforti FM164]
MQRSPAENLVMQRSPAENLLTQRSPARIVVDADLSCEAPSYIAGLVAAIAVATETLKPAGKRGTL